MTCITRVIHRRHLVINRRIVVYRNGSKRRMVGRKRRVLETIEDAQAHEVKKKMTLSCFQHILMGTRYGHYNRMSEWVSKQQSFAYIKRQNK